MCPIKPVKHYFLTSGSVADWLAVKIYTNCTASVLDRCMPKINIFYTVLVQNIENGKLHRQVDSVDAGFNRESQQVPRFFLSGALR